MLKAALLAVVFCLGILLPTFPSAAAHSRSAAPVAREAAWIAFTPSRGGTILFDMRLNGQPVRALLDTGADRSVVSASLARRLDLPFGPEEQWAASGGTATLATVAGVSLEAGAASASGLTIGAADLAAHNAVIGAPFDLLLGMDLLRQWAVEIDYARTRFRLAPTGAVPSGATPFPLRFGDNRHFHWMEASLAGSAPMRLHLDTGFDGHLLLAPASASRIDRSALPGTTTASQGFGGVVVNPLTVMPSLAIGGLAVAEIPLQVDGPSGFVARRRVDGFVGIALLRRFRTLIDFPAGRVFLQESGEPAPPLERSTSGLQWIGRGDAFEVVHVMANSPAAAAGWRAGDRFCAVDGIPVVMAGDNPATAGWSRGAPGREIVLTMCDGTRRSLRLARFY